MNINFCVTSIATIKATMDNGFKWIKNNKWIQILKMKLILYLSISFWLGDSSALAERDGHTLLWMVVIHGINRKIACCWNLIKSCLVRTQCYVVVFFVFFWLWGYCFSMNLWLCITNGNPVGSFFLYISFWYKYIWYFE